MKTSNVHEAKTNLSKLLDAADRGEEVIITRRGSGATKFRVVPQRTISLSRRNLRGSLQGKIHYSADYDSADAEITALLEGTDI